jgi:hypothetical protein
MQLPTYEEQNEKSFSTIVDKNYKPYNTQHNIQIIKLFAVLL